MSTSAPFPDTHGKCVSLTQKGHPLTLVIMSVMAAVPSIEAHCGTPTVRTYEPGWWDAPEKPEVPHQERRLLSTEDTIGFATIGDPVMLEYGELSTESPRLSPDGDMAAVIVRRGNLSNQSVEGVLIIYELPNGKAFKVKPILTVESASSTNFQPLADVNWLSNGRIAFQATVGSDPTQLYEVNVRKRSIAQLSNEKSQPLAIHTNTTSNTVVAFVAKGAANTACSNVACRINTDDLTDAETGVDDQRRLFSSTAMVYDAEGEHRELPRPEEFDPNINLCMYYKSTISPDGRWMLQICQMKTWPEWWEDYRVGRSALISNELRNGINFNALQLYVVDLKTGSGRPLINTILPYHPYLTAAAMWLDEGSKILLPGALMPLAGLSGRKLDDAASHLYNLVVDQKTGHIDSAMQLPRDVDMVTSASWSKATHMLTERGLASKDQKETITKSQIKLEGSQLWHLSPAKTDARAEQHSLTIKESLTERPVIVDLRTKSVVLDPNRWLDGITLGKVEAIEFPVSNTRWTGTLYYPPNFDPKIAYPLILQTHGTQRKKFSLWGEARHFAAQPLAARNMVVVQIDDTVATRAIEGTTKLWPTLLAGYEAAIQSTKARIKIDETHIGLVGWSRTGPYVSYALTHSDRHFAAAVLMDELESSPFNYLSIATSRPYMVADYGTTPFGQGMTNWLEEAPSLNLNRVRTPIFLWTGRTGGIRGTWELYEGLRQLGAPVELWEFPDGDHELVKVDERRIATSLLVDWMVWWMSGETDPSTSKNEQYVRWRAMSRQESMLSNQPRPPLLQWSAKPKLTVISNPQMDLN